MVSTVVSCFEVAPTVVSAIFRPWYLGLKWLQALEVSPVDRGVFAQSGCDDGKCQHSTLLSWVELAPTVVSWLKVAPPVVSAISPPLYLGSNWLRPS